ncbi:MAG TPA: hypothetical protein VHF69_03495, partial [Candidatus Synoicihabitans sp.]|nr:hypothetical protein [Candidatus Synoicihabitans sp.]
MHAPWLVAVISVSLDVIYLNETGRAWINPNSPATCSATSLPELTGVAWTDAVRNEWVPRARVLRQWSGDFDLRDSWGGEIPAHGRLIFQRGSPETGDVFLF